MGGGSTKSLCPFPFPLLETSWLELLQWRVTMDKGLMLRILEAGRSLSSSWWFGRTTLNSYPTDILCEKMKLYVRKCLIRSLFLLVNINFIADAREHLKHRCKIWKKQFQMNLQYLKHISWFTVLFHLNHTSTSLLNILSHPNNSFPFFSLGTKGILPD